MKHDGLPSDLTTDLIYGRIVREQSETRCTLSVRRIHNKCERDQAMLHRLWSVDPATRYGRDEDQLFMNVILFQLIIVPYVMIIISRALRESF